MKKISTSLTVMLILLCFSGLTLSQETITLTGNSLTGSFGAWGGTGYFYCPTFNVNAAGGIDITYYDIDVSQFTEANVWSTKGVALPGVSASNFMTSIDPNYSSIWCNILNMEVASGVDWDGHAVSTLGPDGILRTNDDTRHQGTQDWYRKMTGGKIDGPANGPYYNNESYVTPNPRHPGAPVNTASDLNSYDFRLRILPVGLNAYTYEMWFRMHNSAAEVEGAYWVFNIATNNSTDAWRAFASSTGNTVFQVSDLDLSSAHVFMGLGNFQDPATQSLTWGAIVVTGTPNFVPTPLSVDAGYDQTLYIGYGAQSITLTAATSGSSGDYSYSWSPGGAITQSITLDALTLGEGTHTYTVTATDNVCGNSSSDTVSVVVEDVRCGNSLDKVSIYHSTPNGNFVKLCVSPNAIETHLAHGDVFMLAKGNTAAITELPVEFKLNANYPNPFNPSTKISYQVPVTGNVEISIFNSLGEKIEDLVNEVKESGYYEVEWNASNLSSGIYFYQMKSGEFLSIQKMILMK